MSLPFYPFLLPLLFYFYDSIVVKTPTIFLPSIFPTPVKPGILKKKTHKVEENKRFINFASYLIRK